MIMISIMKILILMMRVMISSNLSFNKQKERI